MGKIAVQNNDVAGEVEADLRAALAVAIKEARSAEAALRRQKAGIERLQDQVWAGTDSIEKAEKNVEKAKQNHIDALAESAASGTAAPMASAVATARKGVVEVQEAVDANRAALAKLKRDLPVWDSNARAAEIEVETKISAILVPVSASLVECGEQIASQLAPIREALAALWGEPSPANHDAALAFEEGRRPLKDAMAAVADFLKSTHIVRLPPGWAALLD